MYSIYAISWLLKLGFVCACFHVCVSTLVKSTQWVESPPNSGWLFLFTFWGSQSRIKGWSGSTLSSSFWVPGFSKCMCMSVCTNVFSIGCSWVAKQPCVCMVEWGWEGRSTRSTETHTHKHYCVELDTSVLLTNGCVNHVGVLKFGPSLSRR